MSFFCKRIRLSSFQLIFLGFAGIILLGSLLLMLPLSVRGEGGSNFPDALFTAVSAVCVTGLVVQDTASYWSPFGQLIILSLIQIGGMGVITVGLCFSMLLGKKIDLFQRNTMQEAIAAPQVGGIVRLTGFIVRLTALFELIGAFCLMPVFIRDFGFPKGCWYAVFHSVSAFCNAGFDLMGVRAPFSSLSSYVGEPAVNLTVMCLIMIGGIGFLTWEDIGCHGLCVRRYRLQSKIVLATSFLLILLPALWIFFEELSELPLRERLLASLFQSVAPRTAGFNSIDYGLFSGNGIALTIVLMLIGGSPGSTAGGMKTTTLAVLLASMLSVFRRKENAALFSRRISDETVKNAAAILLLYLTLFLTGALVISYVEQLPLGVCLFETASAIGTVGLTMGITTGLGALSRWILILLMFMGRVGGLTLIFAAISSRNTGNAKLPLEKLAVG